MSRKVFTGFLAALIVGLSATTILEASIDRGSIQGTKRRRKVSRRRD